MRCTIGILLFCALAAVYFDMMNLARWFFLFAHHLCSFVSGWVVWLIAFGLRSAFVSPLGGLLVSFKLSMRAYEGKWLAGVRTSWCGSSDLWVSRLLGGLLVED